VVARLRKLSLIIQPLHIWVDLGELWPMPDLLVPHPRVRNKQQRKGLLEQLRTQLAQPSSTNAKLKSKGLTPRHSLSPKQNLLLGDLGGEQELLLPKLCHGKFSQLENLVENPEVNLRPPFVQKLGRTNNQLALY
jgi:hypothetical protein